MVVETMPEILIRNGVPRPIRGLEIFEDDPGVFVFIGRVVPDVKISSLTARSCAARPLKPGVLVGRMIQNQLGYYPNAPSMRLPQKHFEIGESAIGRVDVHV